MTSRHLVSAAVAIAAMCAAASPAAAQRYYMRERIAGLPTTAAETYVPTYSNAYGSCVNGGQTAPIASCADASGKPVAISFCGSSPQQSPSRPCSSYSCGSFVPNSAVSGSYATLGKYVDSDAAAKALCEDHAAKNGTSGACLRETKNTRNVYFVPNKTAANVINAWYYDQNASICTKQ